MRLILTIVFLQLTITTDCLSQSKKKNIERETKTDTVDMFQRFDNKDFKEKNTFWTDKNEIGLIQNQWYNIKTPDAGYSIELTIIFYNWDSIEVGKDYDLNSLKSECNLKGVFWSRSYNTPSGQIRLINKTKEQLTFSFDIKTLSTDKESFLIYKGERTFRPDY
jgi:hypothetical protein